MTLLDKTKYYMKRFIFLLNVIALFLLSFTIYSQNVIRNTSQGFIEEKGQFKLFDNLRFHWHHNNVFVYFLSDRAVFITQEIKHENNKNSLEAAAKGDDNLAKKLSAVTVASRFDLVFVNSNKNVQITGENSNSFKFDYYLAHCPDGILNVSSYKKIRYSNLYPNIDLVFSFDGQGLKYEFDVKPGGLPSAINLRWDGLKDLHLSENNEVQFSVGSFDFSDKAPVSYCREHNIATKYILEENNIKFDVADYNKNETLVIDPALYWASSLEYNGYGTWGALVTNSIGQFYYVDWEWNPGGTDVMNYLNSAGSSNLYSSDATNDDIIISKFSKTGALLWACRYGSTREDDISGAVTLDDNDNLFIAGKTFSQGDFPLQTLAGAYNQGWNGTCSGTRGYLLKFGSNNTRLWATYIDNGANFEPFDIACGKNNDIYIGGKSGSTLSCTGITIPTGTGYLGNYTSATAAHNFLLRFNSSGALTWSTWLPGTSNATGRVSDIAIDKSNGDVFLAGDDLWDATYTFSTSLISAPMTYMGQDDMFYMKFNTSNNPVPAYGKYLGGAGFDKINIGAANGDIEVDAGGNLYVCGHTYSANFPVVNPGTCAYYDGIINDGTGITANVASQQDGYLFKVNTSGTISYSTFFGGTGYTAMKQLKKDSHNNLWICGHQTAPGLATVAHADYYNNALTGASDNIMLAQLGTNDNLEWLSYYGFSGYSEYNGFDIWEPTTDSAYLYLAGNFNVTSNTGGGYQYTSASSCSGAAEFRHKLSSAPFTISGATTLCATATTPWTTTSSGGTWSSSNTGIFTVNSSTGLITGVAGGTATLTYSLTISSCVFTATASITVTAAASIASVSGTTPLCIGGTATYTANTVVLGGGTGAWSSSNNAIATVNSSGLVTAVSAGNCNIIYTITGGCGGQKTAQQSVTVNSDASITSVTGTTPLCIGGTATYAANTVVLGGGTGAWSSSNNAIATVNSSGVVTGMSAGNCNIIYTITGGCSGTKTAQQFVTVNSDASIASVTGTTPLCIGGTATYTANTVVLGGGTGAWSSSNNAIATVNSSGLIAAVGGGSCNIIYTITGGCGGTKTAQQSVTVNTDASIASVTGTSPVCIGSTATYAANAVVPGGGTGAWSSSNNAIATVNSSGVVTGVSAGNCNIVYTITGGCGGTQTALQLVTINIDASIASVAGTSPLCIGSTATYTANTVVLGGGTGTWSSSNNAIATVNSSGIVTGVAEGTCDIIYTITGGCGGLKTAQQSVTVNTDASITSVTGTSPICINGTTTFAANTVVFGGGTGAWSSSNTAIATVNSSGIVTGMAEGTCDIIYTITGGCGGTKTAQQSVTVNPDAGIVSVTGAPNTICGNGTTTYTANSVVLGGGTGAWSSSNTSVATVNTSTGEVSAAGTGTCNIIYTVTGGCGGTVSQQLAVAIYNNLIGGTVAASQTICYNQNVAAFTDLVPPSGGTGSYGYQWQIQPGCSGAWTDIAGSDSNIYTHPTPLIQTTCFRRQLTDLCGTIYSDTVTITVNQVLNVSFSGLATYYCIKNDSVLLTGNPSGGTFTGPGIVGNTFYPLLAGVGNHNIVYAYTDTNTCTGSQTQLVEVKALPVVNFSGLNPAYCINNPIANLAGSPSGGAFTGTGVNGTTFSPSIAGTGTHVITYTYTDSYLCTDSSSQNVVVHNLPVVTFDSITPLCANALSITLNTGLPLGGTYSGVGITNNIFNPGIAGVGQHPVTYSYTDVNGCTNSKINTIVVYPSPDVTLPLFNNQCVTGSPVTLSGGNPQGGNYYGNFIVNGIFNPSDAGVGQHTFLYVYTNSQGCTDTAIGGILVVPEVSLTSDATNNSAYVELGQVVNFTTIPANQGNYVFYIDTVQMQSSASNLFATNILESSNTVYVVLNDACSDSIHINMKPAPNAFVPFNTDGKNDIFMPHVDLTIINRWGQELYKGTDGWNGKYNGQNVSPGTYFYIIKMTGLNKEEKNFKGSVTLIGK